MSPRVTQDMAKGEPGEPLMLLPCPFRPKSLRPGHHCNSEEVQLHEAAGQPNCG